MTRAAGPAIRGAGAPAERRGATLSEALLDHYDRNARDLPWRRTGDPYAIWVAEVMLQQTQVVTVVPFYERWMARFPTVESLAAAELEDVLEVWAGLGYYRRARNLHRAALLVRDHHGGRMPRAAAELRTLPGVGAYTAGAIASIAYGEAEPAVDGNVRRVLSRLFDLERPTPASLERLARDLLDAERPGDTNQALMELGATICRPRSPDCPACPLERACLARRRGTVEERPPRSKRSPVPEVEVTAFVVVDPGEQTLLVRRPPEGLLGGLWEFPSTEGAPSRPALAPVVHRFTHLRVTYHPIVVEGSAEEAVLQRVGWPGNEGGRPTRVTPLRNLDRHAVPTGQLRIAERVLEARTAAD